MDSRMVAAALLLVAGVGLIYFGQFYFLEAGAYLTVEDEPVQQRDLPEDANVVAFEELPDDLQRKFERALNGEDVYLGLDPPDSFPENLRSDGFVRYSGEYYDTGIVWLDGDMNISGLSTIAGIFLPMITLVWGGYEITRPSNS